MSTQRIFIHLSIVVAVTLVTAQAWSQLPDVSSSGEMRNSEPGAAANLLSLAELQQRVGQLEATMASGSQPIDIGEHGPWIGSFANGKEISNSSGAFAGAAVILAMPWFEDSVSFTVLSNNQNIRNVHSFDREFAVAPRVWLGYMNGEGTGVRAQYWTYDQDIGPVSGTDSGPGEQLESVLFSGSNITESIFKMISLDGDTIRVMGSLETHVVDLEGVLKKQFGRDHLTASAGLRYASLQTGFHGTLVDNVDTVVEVLSQTIKFEGLGITLSGEGRRELWAGWSVFAGARIATLFGRTRESKDFVSQRSPDKEFRRKAEELLIVFESPLGVQWAADLPSGGRLFARGEVEGHVWANAGNLQSDVNSLGFLGIGLTLGIER